MIIGIEGTGSQGWDNYDLRRTFVREVLEQSRERNKFYFIGPNNEGSDGSRIVKGAWKQLYVGGMIDSRIILVGYSRGAAYCMKLAEMWQQTWSDSKPIDMLVLFDAVARNKYSDSRLLDAKAKWEGWEEVVIPEAVPASVSVVLHAVRNPQAGSRAGFGNVGLSVQDRGKTTMKIKQFMGSHGALGGTSYDAQSEEGVAFLKSDEHASQVDSNFLLNSTMPADSRYDNAPKRPITDKRQDDTARALVGRWMWDLMKAYGVLPSSADFAHYALPFNGNRVPGHLNVVP
jgi:pimeloyl-ACP methyl ester carboxylesterase